MLENPNGPEKIRERTLFRSFEYSGRHRSDAKKRRFTTLQDFDSQLLAERMIRSREYRGNVVLQVSNTSIYLAIRSQPAA